jgi:hypothetical protein
LAPLAARLSEFESDVEALDDLLHWLVEGAVRLKALLADAAGGVGAAADSWTISPGIMPPFPEKSSFGKVRLVSDASGYATHKKVSWCCMSCLACPLYAAFIVC